MIVRKEVGEGGSGGLSDVSHCSHDPSLLHDIRGLTLLSSKMSGRRHDYLVSLVSTEELRKEGRVITSLYLAAVPDCGDSCIEIYDALRETRNPTYLRLETPPENGRTHFREKANNLFSNYTLFLSSDSCRKVSCSWRNCSRTCLVWSEYYYLEGESVVNIVSEVCQTTSICWV